MVSNKDQAKKISQVLRRGCKEFFEDFYAKAEKAGRHPHPLEAALAFGRILKGATEGEWPPQPPDRPGISAEVFDLVNSKFPQEGYHEAVEAWYRHTPGLEIKKWDPGRKPNVELAERIWALSDAGKTSRMIQAALKKDGINLTIEGIEYYRKTRRRRRKQ
ncbi:MAG: hypothetical protein ACLPXT_04815 [Terracidiphilus sp.]